MSLKDFFSPDAITLSLRGASKDEVLAELVGLLRMDERSAGTLLRIIQRRENLGSTGIGRGIAIPHCRSLVVNHLRLAFGRRNESIEFQAIDGKPVSNFFLIVALRSRSPTSISRYWERSRSLPTSPTSPRDSAPSSRLTTSSACWRRRACKRSQLGRQK